MDRQRYGHAPKHPDLSSLYAWNLDAFFFLFEIRNLKNHIVPHTLFIFFNIRT
jgi:hypothetical protein